MNPLVPFLHEGFDRMVRGRLRGVWARGALPDGRVVWAANHHSWWDPFVARALLVRAGREVALVMDDDNLVRFGFLRRLGVVGTREPRAAVASVRQGRVLIVFPEGELRPAGPPGPLARGAAWLAVRADAQLLAVAVRVAVRGHEAPEAYVEIVPVDHGGDPAAGTVRLGAALRSALAGIDGALATADPRAPLPGFDLVVRGRRSWDERLGAGAAGAGRRR